MTDQMISTDLLSGSMIIHASFLCSTATDLSEDSFMIHTFSSVSEFCGV